MLTMRSHGTCSQNNNIQEREFLAKHSHRPDSQMMLQVVSVAASYISAVPSVV